MWHVSCDTRSFAQKPLGRNTRTRLLSAFAAVLWFALTIPAFAVSPETVENTPRYLDPDGRFSFRLSGDWVQLRADAGKGIAGSFLLTKVVGGSRKVVAELLISRVELHTSLSLQEYVEAEDRRAVNTPRLRRIGSRESVILGGCPSLTCRYSFSQTSGPQILPDKVVHQYYALKDGTIWGITLSALAQEEPTLAEVERVVVPSFQFSVPEGFPGTSFPVFQRVTLGGPLGGFSLAVPEKWKVSQNEEHGAFVRGPGAVVYAFSVPREKQQVSPQDAAGSFLKERENLKELRVLWQGADEIGGIKAYAVEYLGTAKQQRWHVRLVTLLRRERVFFIYFVVPEEAWERNSPTFKRIEQTFSVLSPPAAMKESN